MNTVRKTALIVLLTALIFDRLFWKHAIGINLSLFALLIIGLVLADVGWRSLSRGARAAALGTLLSAGMLVVHGSTIATVAVFGGLFLFAGLAHEPVLRTTISGVLQWLSGAVLAPARLVRLAGAAIGERAAPRRGRRWAGLVVLPVVVATVYFLIYRNANSRFEAMTAGFLDGLGEWLADAFREVFTPHTLFFGLGLLFSVSLLVRNGVAGLTRYEGGLLDGMVRRRIKRPLWMAPRPMNALDRERRMGVLLLLLVNGLLLVVNAIDIHWLWSGFEVPAGFSLKEFVHEGTWLLIISILLSMAILLHLFRGNLNFHPANRTLRLLALLWLAQNFILGISVFLRNYHYIAFHGLAYKRIGVIVFLALMLVGLVTLYIKVRERRTFFYLVKVNGWAAFTVLVGLTLVDWDSTIVRYNLHHWNSGEIDVDNYLAMSDKVLPLIYDDIDAVRRQMAKHRENEVRWVEHLVPADFDRDLEAERVRFLQREAAQQWQSWTWADQRTRAALAARHLDTY